MPPESVAVTVYDDEEAPLGVPEMAPVVVLKDRPAGKAGLMLKELADPTGEMVGVALVMAVPATPVIVLVEYVTLATVTAAWQGKRGGMSDSRSHVPN